MKQPLSLLLIGMVFLPVFAEEKSIELKKWYLAQNTVLSHLYLPLPLLSFMVNHTLYFWIMRIVALLK